MFVMAAAAAPLHAEPIDVTIPITSGFATFESPGSGEGSLVELFGGNGFSLIAGLESGVSSPGCCLLPGAITTLRGAWTGSDVVGVATYNGERYPDVGSEASSNHASVNFLSSPFTVPSFDGLSSITVTAPATFTGFFAGHPSSAPAPATLNATLVGSGVGILSLTWSPAIGRWAPTLGTFQLTGNGDVVPEPSSILLVCLSLVGVYAATTFRRRALL